MPTLTARIPRCQPRSQNAAKQALSYCSNGTVHSVRVIFTLAVFSFFFFCFLIVICLCAGWMCKWHMAEAEFELIAKGEVIACWENGFGWPYGAPQNKGWR